MDSEREREWVAVAENLPDTIFGIDVRFFHVPQDGTD